MSSQSQESHFLEFVNISTWLVSVATNVLYSTVLHPTLRHVSNRHLSPFTTNGVFSAAFWLVLYILQVGFLATHWSRDSNLRETNVRVVHLTFSAFNLIQFGWALLWVHKHFVISELFLIANLLIIFRLYVRLGHKMGRVNRSNLARLVFIEAPTARLPLAVLFIDVLHNGAVAFHVHGTLGRILANIFIWIILVIGGGFVIFFRDWVFGFAIAYHTLSLALEQLAIKVVALQWIFAFVIAGTVAFLSVLVLIPQFRRAVEEVAAEHQRDVDRHVDESSRLLGGQS